MRMRRGSGDEGVIIAAVVIILVFVIGGCGLGWPQYNVYLSEKRGQAALAEAEWSKRAAVEQARATKDSAALLAEAEVERAKGVAQANQIIGDSLTGNEAYLRYLWIQGLEDGSGEVIYVPTEAGLPILEASRLAPERP